MRPLLRVRVGSTNRAKLEAVRRGLAPFADEVEIEGRPVESGVSEQPLGFAEIVAGARNRARASFESGVCDFAAGIEDGLVPIEVLPTGFANLGCCVLYDGREEAFGFTPGFEYPPDCVGPATGPERRPIGDVFEERFRPAEGAPEPAPGWGNIGALTEGVLTRAEYGAQAVTCAYVRWLQPAAYRGVYGRSPA